MLPRLARLLGRDPDTAWRAARSPLFCHVLRKMSSQEGKSELIKQSLKKSKLPEGRFDAPEDSNLEKEPLKKFPDDINPVTKEKGGPRGPEPTRYGDWERKGRCIDF
ncbi:succinate dehydrogenase assembly factor 4, mitochondrial [Suncus etruscus]|uniref:succinate dehydrogenase assembly factor 4, mitochondrial-like n=1 Tax=Suncus etruscus TaxID=109475 RepID=UPI00210F4660|nr:succinate dehydrogenase assembly factor 4, mitochondrial-like [Suncus etruscus]XP_049632957.1 succinate dehydrogenase assembly factor 4, mitochondrial [Suncus etruscus]